MKTTIELPDPLFRHAKLMAARRGTTMRQLMIEGLQRIVEAQAQAGAEGFVLTKEEAAVAEIGANGLPVLKRHAPGGRISVSNEMVNRMRDELAI